MEHAQQRRRDKMNQPTGWGWEVDHVPDQIPNILNMDALRRVYVNEPLLLASLGKLKKRARLGGQARAETFRARKEQAKKTARTTWSVEPDLSCRAMALRITQRAGQLAKARTIRRWIAPLRPSTP